jgi:hypothetical protein
MFVRRTLIRRALMLKYKVQPRELSGETTDKIPCFLVKTVGAPKHFQCPLKTHDLVKGISNGVLSFFPSIHPHRRPYFSSLLLSSPPRPTTSVQVPAPSRVAGRYPLQLRRPPRPPAYPRQKPRVSVSARPAATTSSPADSTSCPAASTP